MEMCGFDISEVLGEAMDHEDVPELKVTSPSVRLRNILTQYIMRRRSSYPSLGEAPPGNAPACI